MSTFYDRTTGNIVGEEPLTSLSLDPVYGSRVSFAAKSNQYETQHGFFNAIPMSINSLNAKFELRFDVNQRYAKKLVGFIERQEGHKLFLFDDASNFYQPVSGVCDNYSINHINNSHYEVAISFEVNEAPNLFNWSGMNFINKNVNNWQAGAAYDKYDIVYRDVNTNKLNNFFYCTEDHTSSSASVDGPTGSASKWTQEFFFEPDIGMQNDVNIRVDKIEFKNSFTQRMKTRRNLSVTDFSYQFSNLTTKEAQAIMHFLENKGGYRRFKHSPPSVYDREKVFYCPSWSHVFKYENSHDIQVSLVEDPLGVIPTNT